jgi:hypothetical protein
MLTVGQERFFYHSFPRRFRGVPEVELAKGHQILSAICEVGLVLTPEMTTWQERLLDGSLGAPWTNIQKRCSFTELRPTELAVHGDAFGHFSLEFDPLEFRRLGGIPVFYVPRTATGEPGFDALGTTMLARVGEIQRLLDRLAMVSSRTSTASDKSQLLGVQQPGKEPQFSRASLGAAEDIIAILTSGSQSVEALRDSLRFLSGYFCPTEDLRFTEPLGYYRQREWRLLANVAGADRSLTSVEIDRLLAIDGEFFGKVATYFTGDFRRVDQCRIFSHFQGKPLLSCARRVVVPNAAVNDVRALLRGVSGPEVVALDALV